MSESPSERLPGEKLRVLVAVRVPGPEQISPLLIELYRPLQVCLLGLYVVPEQTAPEQAREQFGEEAVIEAAGRHDLVLVGETEPSVREKVFGDFSRRLADEADVPAIVVRREL